MKKIFALALALIMVLTLAACGNNDTTPSGTTATGTSQPQPGNTTPSDTKTDTPNTNKPNETTAVPKPNEVMDFDIGISTIPVEWQKAIGKSMYGMNTGAMGDCTNSYTNKFGGVSADDYAKLIAYFDTLSYTEKLDGVYNCNWGQLQIGHNSGASEMTIVWCAY